MFFVSIPFKREGISKAIFALTATTTVSVSIPFKREGIYKDHPKDWQSEGDE